MKEFPQTVGNLTEIGTTLYELIKGGNLIAYPDADIARALGYAVAKETSRGFMITKEKSSHKIDVVVALAMACHECVRRAHVTQPPLVGPVIMGRDGEAIVDWTMMPRPQPLPELHWASARRWSPRPDW